MSKSLLDRSLKILGRARPYPKFGDFFSVHNVQRKFLGRGTTFGRNQGVVGPESIPKTVAVVVKGEFWDIFDHTSIKSRPLLGVVKNVPECPSYNYYV